MKEKLKSLVFICCITLIICCNSEKKNTDAAGTINPDVVKNPATASGNGKENNQIPEFQFDVETHDFGTITEGEKVSYAFKFKNSGKGDLIIRSATGSCGCTVPEYSKDPIVPGKEGIINVTFNSEGKEGKQNKTVTIVANTIPNTKVLTITGEVKKK